MSTDPTTPTSTPVNSASNSLAYIAVMIVVGTTFVGATVELGIASGAGNQDNQRGNIDTRGVIVGLLVTLLCVAIAAVAERRLLQSSPVLRREIISQQRAARRGHRLAATQPRLALELGIGRPDLNKGFPDGGLLDLNHLPSDHLMTLLKIPASDVEEIVNVRQQVGGFESLTELLDLVSLTSEIPHDVVNRLIFCSRSQ